MEIRTNELSTSERHGRAGGGGSNARRTCTYCKKREPSNARPEQKLKRCSRCRTSAYCSRACQRADWKKGHRRTCISGAIMARNSCYLDGLQSEEMVMDQLVDAYRLRVEDERMYCGRLRGRYSVNTTRTSASPPAVVDAERSAGSNNNNNNNNNNTGQALQYALQDFQDFLDLAESESRSNNHSNEGHRDYDNAEEEEEEDTNGDSSSPSSSTTTDNSSSSSPPSSLTLTATTIATTANETTKQGKDATILPQWWDAEKRALCEARAVDGSGDIWSNLGNPAGKDDIIHHYQDNLMPMKLRMLAERVYGSDVMGQFRL